MRTILPTMLFAIVCWLSTTTAAFSDDKRPGAPTAPVDEPGTIHRELAMRAGEYTTVSKFWKKPGAEPIVTTGTAKITAAVDGRFIIEEFDGAPFGPPIKGMRVTGYSNHEKKYESTWAFSLSTAMMPLVGTTSDSGKTIEWRETAPVAKGANQSPFAMTRFIDDDHFAVDLLSRTADGSKQVKIETVYSRKK